MSFEKKVKRLSQRDWPQVSEGLLQYVAELSFTTPGQQPAFSLSELPSLTAAIQTMPRDGELRVERIPGLGAAMLHEGVFLLHKCANVLVASHDQAAVGLPTWSLPTGYQAAYFSADAILKLLGVAVIEVNSIPCTVDIWPEPPADLSRKQRDKYQPGSEIQLIRHDRLQHHHRWAVLKRVLRTTSGHPMDLELCEAIKSIGERDFARQRNELHYGTSWKFSDLHAYCSPIGFLRPQDKVALVSYLQPDRDEFSIALANVLFSFGVALLTAIAGNSPVIEDERALLVASCASSRMKLWERFQNAGLGTLA